ncbi:MAG: TIM barrel protein [Thermodesulfobacteriota bacterium]
MPRFFVNLPLSYIAREPEYLAAFIARGLHPELGLDSRALDALAPAWHQETASRLQDAGLTCSIHLPFLDLQPGALDPGILAATRARLLHALDVARIYAPRHLIGHAWYFETLHRTFYDVWLTNAADTWEAVHNSWAGHPPLYLENTFEPMPEPLVELLGMLAGRGLQGIGLCLDLGHWHSFAQGVRLRNLDRWLDAFSPFLGHVHLHDNSGADDHHLGLGQGDIPWAEVFSGLAARGLSPTRTLEPHTADDLEHSLAFISGHPEWFPPA